MSAGTPVRKVALVTGAAGDIGGAVVRRLVADGWSIAAADHPAAPGLASIVAEAAALGAEVRQYAFDVGDADAVATAVEACIGDLGTPHALVSSAGRQGAFTTIDRYPLDDLRSVFEVNIIGAFQVLQAVSRAMIRDGRGGSVVNVASMAGVTGAPNMSAYSASKAAVIGLTKSAAKDLAPHGIRVNAVSPAFIGPGLMWERQVRLQAEAGSQYYADDPTDVERQMIGSIPLRRLGRLSEVADVVAFLAGEQSSYVTGHNIEISGGAA
jgi:NAD(P)-dependent dehydrogenase (short-subunit alcohol dehydrogenase family)